MSRRTHGLVALLATATLVALLIAWWASDRDPVEPTTTPTQPPSAAPSVPSSGSAAPSSAPAPPTGPPPVVVPGRDHLALPADRRPVPLTVVTFNIHSGIGRNGLQLAQVAGEIAAVEPDVVLLQEVDQNRLRSRFVDEADYLAALLGMEHVFASNVERDGLRAGDPVSDYGTAVLTRLRSRAGPTPCCRTGPAASNAASSTWCCGSGVGRSASTTPTSTTPRPACGSSRCASPATSSASTATP